VCYSFLLHHFIIEKYNVRYERYLVFVFRWLCVSESRSVTERTPPRSTETRRGGGGIIMLMKRASGQKYNYITGPMVPMNNNALLCSAGAVQQCLFMTSAWRSKPRGPRLPGHPRRQATSWLRWGNVRWATLPPNRNYDENKSFIYGEKDSEGVTFSVARMG